MAEIDTEAVYKQLKKQNGEKFAQAIRSVPDVLNIPNIVHILEFAGKDANEAQSLARVIHDIYKKKHIAEHHSDEAPLDLLRKAGYKAWVVENVEQQNAIAGYFRSPSAAKHGMTGGHRRSGSAGHGELICTIYSNWDRGAKRFDEYYIINAVKNEAWGDDKLAEEDWHIKPAEHPEREDEYGRSVISIQILKTGGVISIKNRYNHTVSNPDATFFNNPDNIIPGLTDSLKKFFGVDFTVSKVNIPDHFHMVGDQFLKFNYEINDYYFGNDYYCNGSTITKLNKDNQILFGRGLLLNIAKENNTVTAVTGDYYDDEFAKELTKIINGKKIRIEHGPDRMKPVFDGFFHNVPIKTKSVLVDGERFIDVDEEGKITFINAPNIDTIKFGQEAVLSGDLDFSGVNRLNLVNTDLHSVTGIKLNPNANAILMGHYELSGDLDFSGVEILDLQYARTQDVTNIKFNPNANMIRLGNHINLSGDLDFSGVNDLTFRYANTDNVKSVKFNPHAHEIIMCSLKRGILSGNLDFSGVEKLEMTSADFSDATNVKFNPNAELIDLNGSYNISGNLDFSNVKSVKLDYANLTKATNIKLSPDDAHKISLRYAKLGGNLDFGNIKGTLYLYNTDLTQVKSMKFNPRSLVRIDEAKVAGDLDFSNVKDLTLRHANFSGVTSIKLHPKTYLTLRNEIVFVNGQEVAIKDLEKHGIALKQANVFEVARKTILDRMHNKIPRGVVQDTVSQTVDR